MYKLRDCQKDSVEIKNLDNFKSNNFFVIEILKRAQSFCMRLQSELKF